MAAQVHILMYHQVGLFPKRPLSHRAQYCHLPRFRAQLSCLKKLGYTPVSLSKAEAGLRGKVPLPSKPVVLSFDDGYVNFLEEVVPVLQSFGFPAIVYAVSGHLGGTSYWGAPEGLTPRPLMDAAALRAVRRLGFEVGSHTITHPRMAQENAERLRQETVGSKAALEDILGESVPHFCYPYGSYGRAAIDAVAQAGYHTATTCVQGVVQSSDDPLALPRKPIAWRDGAFRLWTKLAFKKTPRRPMIRREVSFEHDPHC